MKTLLSILFILLVILCGCITDNGATYFTLSGILSKQIEISHGVWKITIGKADVEKVEAISINGTIFTPEYIIGKEYILLFEGLSTGTLMEGYQYKILLKK